MISLDSIDVLILDEADRMLDEFFIEQVKEIIMQCGRARQTMLFSATMSHEVRDLVAVSLRTPVKVFDDDNRDVAFNLRQEFIRIRPNHEGINQFEFNTFLTNSTLIYLVSVN